LGFFFCLADYGRDCLKVFAAVEINQFDAHRISTGFATFFDSRTHGWRLFVISISLSDSLNLYVNCLLRSLGEIER
jgi:hypothetical protein